MTDHPCKGLPPRAVEAFERIACGDALPPMAKGTAAKLLAKGVIVAGEEKQIGDRFGKFSIPQYFVPLSVHMQWCEWCGEQPEDQDGQGTK